MQVNRSKQQVLPAESLLGGTASNMATEGSKVRTPRCSALPPISKTSCSSPTLLFSPSLPAQTAPVLLTGAARSARARLMHPALQTVLVTGAGGKTGGLTLKKLLEQSSLFQARAFVHSEQVRSFNLQLRVPSKPQPRCVPDSQPNRAAKVSELAHVPHLSRTERQLLLSDPEHTLLQGNHCRGLWRSGSTARSAESSERRHMAL